MENNHLLKTLTEELERKGTIDLKRQDQCQIKFAPQRFEEIQTNNESDPNTDREYNFDENVDKFVVLHREPFLKTFQKHFEIRKQQYEGTFKEIVSKEGGLLNFARGYKNYGLNASEQGITYKEWLPGAKEVYLIGDFNQWNKVSHPLKRDEFGHWDIFLPKINGKQQIPHNSLVKFHVVFENGERADKIPAWIKYAIQDSQTNLYCGNFWNPEQPYQFMHPTPNLKGALKIYEAHIGLAGIEGRVHTYLEFTTEVLPRIKKAGYNCIQLMAIMEHAYYGSFGYHVTNFFAASSRFGNPDDLKKLIDTAHSMGILVIMDLVHSHSSSNSTDGLAMLDGTDYQYFHSGAKGFHTLWDSFLFNYGKWEVLRFLLSNLCFYIEEYKFDGFRFDGVTSMLYLHHGIKRSFDGSLHEYFSEWADMDAIVYLMLANTLVHRLGKVITIAEDVSGYPSLCIPIKEGGIGFDYRLGMCIPDKWIEFLDKYKDEDWDLKNMAYSILNRRYDEKTIAYCECHDQAIVGDKAIAMWLFKEEIYYNMAISQPESPVIHRGMALHKMIKMMTLVMGGEAYLNFIGNEFGHPEWIDFPRKGNNWSYEYCRRKWDLCDNEELRYKYLKNFDQAMLQLEDEYQLLNQRENYLTLADNFDKLIIFERGGLLFIFNFHPTTSFNHYRIGTKYCYDHIIIFDSDESRFGGHERLRYGHCNKFPLIREPWQNRPNHIVVYIPSRTMIVFRPVFEQSLPPHDQQISNFQTKIQELSKAEKEQQPKNKEEEKQKEEEIEKK